MTTTNLQFNSEKWNSNTNCSKFNDFAITVINNLKEMFNTSSETIVALLSGNDNDDVMKLKAKTKFFVNSNHTPVEYRKFILGQDSLENRLIQLLQTICTYRAHKAWLSGRRFSCFDGWGDSDAVKDSYKFYFENNNTEDWKTLREYIITVATM